MNNNQIRTLLSIFWIILGIVLLTLSVLGILNNTLFGGMGGALIAVGCLQLYRHIKYSRDKDYKEKIDIEISDERNRYLRLKSWAWAGYITVLVEAIASVVAYISKQELIGQMLCYSICLITFTYWLSYMILSRKY